MIQVVEQTHEEKVAMYMKSTKRELIEMLIECNRHLDSRPLEYCEVDLDELEKRLDEVLDKETGESLNVWINRG